MNRKKPIPFHTLLNQPPRSAKHGNWRAPTPTYDRSPNRASPSAGTEDDASTFTSVPVTTWRTLHPPKDSGNLADITAQWQKEVYDKLFQQMTLASHYVKPFPITVPYEGVHVGEVFGVRAWWVMAKQPLVGTDDRLRPFLSSLGHLREWVPDETVSGDINEVVIRDAFRNIYGGIYSYKTEHALWAELSRWSHYNFPQVGHFHEGSVKLYGIVIGTVKCWGEVVEHDRGMRAQYAKLASIDQVFGCFSKDVIEAIYLPKEKP